MRFQYLKYHYYTTSPKNFSCATAKTSWFVVYVARVSPTSWLWGGGVFAHDKNWSTPLTPKTHLLTKTGILMSRWIDRPRPQEMCQGPEEPRAWAIGDEQQASSCSFSCWTRRFLPFFRRRRKGKYNAMATFYWFHTIQDSKNMISILHYLLAKSKSEHSPKIRFAKWLVSFYDFTNNKKWKDDAWLMSLPWASKGFCFGPHQHSFVSVRKRIAFVKEEIIRVFVKIWHTCTHLYTTVVQQDQVPIFLKGRRPGEALNT